ncbi:1-acyl-sn-glycerol-3-phosphate acyltransferase [Actinomyces mediterranea]|uniref:1-acyl-sn-glycerol-3-phosphate acyltransferase n=1 Tax=Actinomyces mediterranea TaxID=1871028 RepID=UPI0009707199|nr:1-acyl-sn-glycerol-3-phosphate acyltransferase [Actinomyces mediterranea]
MRIRRLIAQTYLRFSRWTFVSEPLADKTMVIGAPHTSNWDGVFMALSFWSIERPFTFLVKDSVINVPVFGSFIKWVGGFGVDRTKSNGIVGQVVDAVKDSDSFTIVLTPKGTRSPREYWKSGFYRIALGADLPVQLGFVDAKTRTFGWGPSIRLTDDIAADMDKIRQFYADKEGVNAEKASVPRLRAEDEADDETL